MTKILFVQVEDAYVDTPWISRLAGYVSHAHHLALPVAHHQQVVYLHDVWPSIRIIGICFGHQSKQSAISPETS